MEESNKDLDENPPSPYIVPDLSPPTPLEKDYFKRISKDAVPIAKREVPKDENDDDDSPSFREIEMQKELKKMNEDSIAQQNRIDELQKESCIIML